MMENEDFNASEHSERIETGLLGAISVELKFNFIIDFCTAEQ